MFLIFIFIHLYSCQTIKHLNEISINEELPIGTIVTSLTDKIPNLDQSIEYDLVTPLSTELDLFTINHKEHQLEMKTRLDYEDLCLKKHHCILSVSIAVSNDDSIYVYILPIRIKNLNDNPIKFLVNRTVIEINENDEYWFNKNYLLPKAYDDDGDSITYSIYLQNWNKPDGLFGFNHENLTLKPLKKFDREEQNIYLLRLIAHNQNDAATDIIVLIKDLNDNAPICQQNQSIFRISNTSIVSTFLLNVTDFDEGDNGKLEYFLIDPLAGFTIDRYNGLIKFDYKQWKRSNQSILNINVTDHGKPFRLSTICSIEIVFTFLYEIEFQFNYSISNQTEISVDIKNVNLPLGKFHIYDKQEKQICKDCLIHINSSIENLFYLDYLTYDLYFNLNSILLMKILTNYNHNKENLTLNIQIEIKNHKNPSIISRKTYLFKLYFNKINILTHSNTYFLKIHENTLLNKQISIYNRYHHCLNNHSNDLILTDSTNTFEIDKQFNLIIKKHLNIKQQNIYQLLLKQKPKNSTEQINHCSVQLHIYIVNPYSSDSVYPYFSQSFYILSSKNLSEFILPSIPSHVKYISSIPDLISIDPSNGSIIIRSSSLYTSYYYDFQIEVIDSHIPSLSCSIPIRIFFGINKHSPRLLINSTRQSIEVLSSNFIYQIKAYDPDILLNDQMNFIPPSIEYHVDISNKDVIEIERYTGRIFLKNLSTTTVNFTLILTDFGQPNRLITQQNLIFDIKSTENFPVSFFLITAFIILSVILISFLILILNFCCLSHKKSSKNHEWKNISPTTVDTRLIDNEYFTRTTSLPREEKPYPIFLNKQTNSSHLSLNDINKYLERFEKIYNDSSSQQYLHEPLGSVV